MSSQSIVAQAADPTPSYAVLPDPVTPTAVPPPAPEAPPTPPEAPEGVLDQLLAFIYTLTHWAGELLVYGLRELLPTLPEATLDSLVDPIGYLALLTVFLIVAEVAKKISWLILVVGWALIMIRIALEVTQST